MNKRQELIAYSIVEEFNTMHSRYEDHMINQITETERREAPWSASRAVTRIVWCLKCVKRVEWAPGQDGHLHIGCGHPLSLCGPFEERPSWFPTPQPLPRRWWIGNRPKETSNLHGTPGRATIAPHANQSD